MDVKTLAWQEKETVVSLRRHFHENPELSQKEFKTMDTIEEFLQNAPDILKDTPWLQEKWHNGRFQMDQGVIAEDGPPSQIFEAPENERTKEFLSRFIKH